MLCQNNIQKYINIVHRVIIMSVCVRHVIIFLFGFDLLSICNNALNLQIRIKPCECYNRIILQIPHILHAVRV